MKIKTLKTSPFYFLFFSFSLSFFVLYNCDSSSSTEKPDYAKNGSQYRDTTGPINVLTVVSDSTVFNALIPYISGEDVLGKPLPAVLIPQSYYGFRNYPEKDFNKQQTTRAVLLIKKGDPKFVNQPGMYAKNQAYMEVYGNNIGDVKNVIFMHKDEITGEIERANFAFLADKMENDHAKELAKLGVYMKIPSQYDLVQEKDNYQWYRLDQVEQLNSIDEKTGAYIGSQTIENFNIQVETGNIGKSELSKSDISTIVNSYGLNRLNSAKDNPLQIQQDFISVDPAVSSEKYIIYDIDGMWETRNEPYGGSFLGRLIVNKANNNMYFTLVSINAPDPKRKRQNVMHALSMVKSFKVLKEN